MYEQNKNPKKVIKEIQRQTRRKFSAEEKIRIVLEGLRGEESIAAICRKSWGVDFFACYPAFSLLEEYQLTRAILLTSLYPEVIHACW